ncbi:MAG: hypothetical protein ABI333_05475 [bacterium]
MALLAACGDSSLGGDAATHDASGISDAGTGDGDVSDAGTDAGETGPLEVSYCSGQMAGYELPEDPAQRGPWPVGARTVTVGDLTVEVWYPAARGSEAGLELHVYDLREHLPDDQTVAESDSLKQPCDCYRDLPLDPEHGPYSPILFMHGFSGFRGQSLELTTHWASRGFVVVAADHPSIGLKTFLTDGIGGLIFNLLLGGGLGSVYGDCDLSDYGGQRAEGIELLDALHSPQGDLAFLDGYIDTTRMGAAGHSAGGGAVAALPGYAGVQVVAPMSMRGTCEGAETVSSLVMGGMADGIIAYSQTQDGYESSPSPKRLVGLTDAGHMAFTSFCPIGASEGGILQAAQNAGVQFDAFFLSIIEPLASDGCGPDALAPELGWAATNFVTTAAFEERLLCLPERGHMLRRVLEFHPVAVGEFREDP